MHVMRSIPPSCVPIAQEVPKSWQHCPVVSSRCRCCLNQWGLGGKSHRTSSFAPWLRSGSVGWGQIFQPIHWLKIPHPIAFMGEKTIHRENFYSGVPYSQRNGDDMMQIWSLAATLHTLEIVVRILRIHYDPLVLQKIIDQRSKKGSTSFTLQ